MERESAYLIALLKSVLDGSQPPELFEGISFSGVYELAVFHSVECMSFYGIERLKKKPEEALFLQWKKRRDGNTVKSLVQDAEKERILDALTAEKIRVLPLKGCLLQGMYPQLDYRQMADLDILIDEERAKDARRVMESLGYKTEHFDISNQDVYMRPPVMNVEIHKSMLPDSAENYEYYTDIWEKARPQDGCPGRYVLSREDYYLFMLAHFAKHYYGGGSGIRSILDIAVFQKKYGETLDCAYVERELKSLGLTEFARTAECLAAAWFGGGQMNEPTEEMAKYILSSGVYGTKEQWIDNKMAKMSGNGSAAGIVKIRFFLLRMLPGYKIMCGLYPVLKKAPFLLPFMWARRLFNAMRKKREIVKTEFREIVRWKDEK